jgi:hypothetical protein
VNQLTHSRNKTDTETCEETTCDKQGLSCRCGLQNNTKVEDKTSCGQETDPSAKDVGERSGKERTKERSL